MARPKKAANGIPARSAPKLKPLNGAHMAGDSPPPGLLDDEDPADAAATVEIAVATLSGDLRDFILDRLRHEQDKKPWNKRSESAQRDTIHDVEAAVETVLRRAVEMIAAQGRKAIQAKLESVTVKDGIKAQLILSRFDAQRHNLVDATGASVLIVVADSSAFTGERAPAGINPDQASLLGDVGVVHSPPDNAATPFA